MGISHWLSDCAVSSSVFSNNPVSTISNAVNTTTFSPVEKTLARDILKLPKDKKIVLLGAQNTSDFYKGFDLFVQSLSDLDVASLQFVFFGKAKRYDLEKLDIDQVNLGFLSDSVSLKLAYSAADVFVAPSRMDAFGKTLAEAMACGTPVLRQSTRNVFSFKIISRFLCKFSGLVSLMRT